MKLKLILYLLLPLGVLAQQPPACTPSGTSSWKGAFTTAAAGTTNVNNTANPNCNAFALSWTSPTTGITALSIQLEGSDDNTTFTAFTGTTTVLVGANPSTALSGVIIIQASSKIAYIRARMNSISGSGVVNYQIYGYNGVTPTARGSGGGGTVTTVTATAPIISSGGTAPNITATYHGTSPHIQLSDNTGASGDLASFDSAGNVTDSTIASSNVMQISINNVGTSAFGLDMSGSTQANAVRLPVVAGATATLNGVLDYDSTSNNLHTGHSSADSILPVTTVTPGNGNCANWSVSGGSIKLGDAGAACGSGSGGGGGVVTYSGPALSVLTGTTFCPIGGGGAASATESNVDIDSSAAAAVSNLYVQLSQALGTGNSVVVTWRDNAVSKTVTCTISGASATSCNDTTHSFNVANGDLLDYQMVFSGTIVVTPTILIMSAFGTSNVGVTSVFGNTGPTVGAVGDIGATGQVLGLKGVPFCTGFTPTTGQNLQYTTASSPNPCYTAAAAAGGGSVTFGTYAGLPATCTTGAVYFFTDKTIYTRAGCTSTNTWTLYYNSLAVTTPPACASLTFVNQNAGGLCTNTQGAMVMSQTVTAGCCSNQLLVEASPSTPYSFSTTVVYSGPTNTFTTTVNGYLWGVLIRDSASGKFTTCGVYNNTATSADGFNFVMRMEHWTNATTDSATAAALYTNTLNPLSVKLVDSGTNHICYYSQDLGLHWNEVFSESRTAFVPSGGNQIGFQQLNFGMPSLDVAYLNYLDFTQGTN